MKAKILLLVSYIISSQCVSGPVKEHIASKNDMLHEIFRNITSDLEIFRDEFELRVKDVMTSFWSSLEEFSREESQRLARKEVLPEVTPLCYSEYIGYLMFDLRGIFMMEIGESCSRKGIFSAVKILLTMQRYVQVLEALLESIRICHKRGSKSLLTVQNAFCDHAKHHNTEANTEILLEELKDGLSNLRQDCLKYNWFEDRMCFENTSKQIRSNLTNIFPVILTECERAGNYTNMLKILSLWPLSVDKFIPSIPQKEIDEDAADLKLLGKPGGELKNIHLVERYEDTMRNQRLFRRLMVVAQDVQEIEKHSAKVMLLYHNAEFNDTARFVENMIQVEDRNGDCGKHYVPTVLSDLRQFYDSQLATKCFKMMSVLSHMFQFLLKMALNISDSLLAVPLCDSDWECDAVESQITFMEDTAEYWEDYSNNNLILRAETCYASAREVVEDNVWRNRHKMKECLMDVGLTENMFEVTTN